jgi:hypothetical protein
VESLPDGTDDHPFIAAMCSGTSGLSSCTFNFTNWDFNSTYLLPDELIPRIP